MKTQRRKAAEAQSEELNFAPSRLGDPALHAPFSAAAPDRAEEIELPAGWQSAQLAELARVQAGGSAPQGDHWFGGKNPFVRVQHLDQSADWVRRWDLITDEAVREHSLKLFPKGTIVLPKSGASIRLEKRGMLTTDAFLVSHLAAISPYPDRIDREFLFYALRSMRLSEDKADGYPTLNLTELEQTDVRFPNQPEQQAIASVLRTVQGAKEACERVLAATRQLKHSLLHHLFTCGPVPFPQAAQVPLKGTEIGPMPEHWSVVSVGDIETFMQYGTSSRCESGGSGLPVLRIPNVVEGRIDTADIKYLAASPTEIKRHLLQRGDLLFVRTNGVRENVGRCAVYLGSPARSLFASYLIRARLAPDRALPEFIQLFTETNTGRASFTGRASGAADGKFNINTQTIRSTILPLPPLSEQREIAAQLAAVDAKLAAEESRRSALAALFQSLLHHLMTGKVRLPEFAGSAKIAARKESHGI